MGNNCFKTTLLMRAVQLARAQLPILELSRFRMFKVRPQDNVVLESCLGCFQIPLRMGGARRRAHTKIAIAGERGN